MTTVNVNLSSHSQFKTPHNHTGFVKFAQALYEPLYDGNGNSSYFMEICKFNMTNTGIKVSTGSFENRITKLDTIKTRIALDNKDGDVFFSVAPRDYKFIDEETSRSIRTGGGNVSVATCCWLDMDYKHFSNDSDKAEDLVVQKILQLDPFPNIIVKTPGGYHLYFLLENAYPIGDVTYTNRRLEVFSGADSCGDAARIMRVPVGFHRKDPTNPRKVQIIHFDDTRRCTLEDFDHYPVVNQPAPLHYVVPNLPAMVLDPDLDVESLRNSFKDPRLVDKINAPTLDEYKKLIQNSKSDSRSERDFHIICQLLKSNIELATIRSIFAKYPCGEKYLEKGKYADQYLLCQITAAQYRIDLDEQFNKMNIRVPAGTIRL